MAISVSVLQFERVLKKRSSSSHFKKEGLGKASSPKNNHHFPLRQLLLYYYAYQMPILCVRNRRRMYVVRGTMYEQLLKTHNEDELNRPKLFLNTYTYHSNFRLGPFFFEIRHSFWDISRNKWHEFDRTISQNISPSCHCL